MLSLKIHAIQANNKEVSVMYSFNTTVEGDMEGAEARVVAALKEEGVRGF